MENLIIKATRKTPAVNFNATSGLLELSGRSTPENTEEVFLPMIQWLEQYLKNPAEETVLQTCVEYYNNPSLRQLQKILKHLENHSAQGNRCLVKWIYEQDDEDMIETGKEYSELFKLPFEMIEIPENKWGDYKLDFSEE